MQAEAAGWSDFMSTLQSRMARPWGSSHPFSNPWPHGSDIREQVDTSDAAERCCPTG